MRISKVIRKYNVLCRLMGWSKDDVIQDILELFYDEFEIGPFSHEAHCESCKCFNKNTWNARIDLNFRMDWDHNNHNWIPLHRIDLFAVLEGRDEEYYLEDNKIQIYNYKEFCGL